MIHKLRTLRAMDPPDRACLVRALRLLPLVRVRVWLLGARRTQAWLAGGETVSMPTGTAGEKQMWQIVRMVRVARRYHRFWTNCLSHSLTLWALLRREGVATEVRVGTRRRGGRLEAHAWVEWEGRPLTDPDDDTGNFEAFERPLIARSP